MTDTHCKPKHVCSQEGFYLLVFIKRQFCNFMIKLIAQYIIKLYVLQLFEITGGILHGKQRRVRTSRGRTN